MGAQKRKDRIKFRVLRFDRMAPGLPTVSSQRRGLKPAIQWQAPYRPQPSHGESSGPPGMTAVHQDRPKLPSGNPAAFFPAEKGFNLGCDFCSQGILQKIAACHALPRTVTKGSISWVFVKCQEKTTWDWDKFCFFLWYWYPKTKRYWALVGTSHYSQANIWLPFHITPSQPYYPPPQCHPIQQIRPYVGIVKGSWWLKKTLVFFRALLCGPNHWLLPSRRAAATAKKRWWLNQPSWERNIFCLALKKLHSWIDMSFWSFFSKKLHLRIQCVCFFPLQISAFQCEKNLILDPVVVGEERFLPFGLQNSREKNKGVPLSEMLNPWKKQGKSWFFITYFVLKENPNPLGGLQL